MRRWAGYWMRRVADRVDPVHAPRILGLRYGYVQGVGLVVGWSSDDRRRVGSRLLAVSSDPDERAAAWSEEIGVEFTEGKWVRV